MHTVVDARGGLVVCLVDRRGGLPAQFLGYAIPGKMLTTMQYYVIFKAGKCQLKDVSMDDEVVTPATLAGRCANGYERGRGAVVHAVPASPRELQFGINAYAKALCGKTHGARSAGWSHQDADTAITCGKCSRLLASKLVKPGVTADLEVSQ